MVEVDIEDYLEEVKFQMTQYELLTESVILDWEDRVREWIRKNGTKRKAITIKSEDDICIKLKKEEEMEEEALQYYKAVKQDQIENYWKQFCLG